MDTDVLGAERGVTFWRPQAPLGYAVVGDCVTAGSAQPTFQVRFLLALLHDHLFNAESTAQRTLRLNRRVRSA